MESIGPYRLDSELGRGAMGVVFCGFDPAIGRAVAIKIIRLDQSVTANEKAELKLRFAREATAAGKLSHPNIVTVYQLGDQGDMQYLVLELVEGCSLEKALSRGRPSDRRVSISVLSQVASAWPTRLRVSAQDLEWGGFHHPRRRRATCVPFLFFCWQPAAFPPPSPF